MKRLLRMRLKLGVCWGPGLLTFEMPVLKWSHLDFLEMWLLLASEVDLGIYCLWDKKPSTSHSLESFFALSFAPSKFSTLDEHSCYRPVLIALLTCASPQPPRKEFSIEESEFELKLLQSVAVGMLVDLYYSSSQLEPWRLITELTALVDLVFLTWRCPSWLRCLTRPLPGHSTPSPWFSSARYLVTMISSLSIQGREC